MLGCKGFEQVSVYKVTYNLVVVKGQVKVGCKRLNQTVKDWMMLECKMLDEMGCIGQVWIGCTTLHEIRL